MFKTFLFGLLLPTVTRTQAQTTQAQATQPAETEMEREIREEAARKEAEFFEWVKTQVHGK